MLSRERVMEVINHRQPDRVPVYGWVRANLAPQITAEFGSVEAFEDYYEFDFAHLFGGPRTYTEDSVAQARAAAPEGITPTLALELETSDPDDDAAYADIKAQVQHHKSQRARFVYVQTPGIFEALNGVFGIENHLAYLLLYPDELRRVYQRQAEWNLRFAMNCLDAGVDMIHVSDDWGAQHGLMFRPETWWEMIHPFHIGVCRAVKQRGAFLSLHSDGNVVDVIDGIVDLGFDVVHPWQESAGMSLDLYSRGYRDNFVVMGGLDVQTTIGFGKKERLASEIDRVIGMFRNGGLLYCTSHFVQEHCTMDELRFAFDTVRSTCLKYAN